MTVFQLTPDDTSRYVEIRRRMLASDPWAFSASPESDRGLDEPHLKDALLNPYYAIFGFASDDATALAGVTGLMRRTNPKFKHRASIWGVYVLEAHRGSGIGRALMNAAIALGRTWDGVDFLDLGVSENAPAALALYQDLGFEIWGREPESTDDDGTRYDEIFLSMCLR